MQERIVDNKRIAKNTLILYTRTLLTMVVSLYTSRILLEALGIDNYGIYNAVGGFVAMFSVLSGSLSNAISRFITFELGRNNPNRLQRVFSTSITVQFILSLILLLIAETVGLWFVHDKMEIPLERFSAAIWVYQFSVITFVINLISVPYNAVIIAHERMSVFAYVSLLEVFTKLAITYMISVTVNDRLILYGFFLMLVAIIIRIIYGQYCKCHFYECVFDMHIDKKLLHEMSGFVGWNLIGNASYVLNTQGIHVMSNLFFGVAINAARGVASQVEYAVTQFVNNFTTAINPQITKLYAIGDIENASKLVCQGAKCSFFMMFLLVSPIIIETDFIMGIWLKHVPEYSILFVRLTLCLSLCSVLSNTLVTMVYAIGQIKKYQLLVGAILLLSFLITYMSFRIGFYAHVAYIVSSIIHLCLLYIRLFLLKRMVDFQMNFFFKNVVIRILPVILLSLIFLVILRNEMQPSCIRLIFISVVSVLWNLFLMFYIGLDKMEQDMIVKFVLQKVREFKER